MDGTFKPAIMTEEISKEYLASLITSRNPIILDIGCYDCKDSIELSKHLPASSRFHVFDPDPRSIEMAAAQEGTDNFKLYDLAICNTDGPVGFWQSESDTRRNRKGQESWSASGSIKPPNEHLDLFPDVYFNKPISVKGMKLTTWYRENLYPLRIDLIWADVNGGEEDLINGGTTALACTRYLYIEFAEKELYSGQINRQKIIELMYGWEVIGEYGFQGNFGNLLLRNKNF